MKKALFSALILLAAFTLGGCGSPVATPPKANPSEASVSGPVSIVWKEYGKKYGTLAGIRYPADFVLDDSSAIEISSVANLMRMENGYLVCAFSAPCQEKGLMIVIGLTKPLSREVLEDTQYPNIKRIDPEKVGHPEGADGIRRQEYAYLSKDYHLDYAIGVYDKNFPGDPAAIVDGILSSLREEE